MAGATDRLGETFGSPQPAHRPVRSGEAGTLNQVRVENEILRLCKKLEDMTDELGGRARIAAESDANHKGIWASHFIQAKDKEVTARKARADEQCHELYMKKNIDEALYESTKKAMESLRTQIDSLRTISANLRAQT